MTEAWVEMEKLSSGGRTKIEALTVSWKIFASQERWEEAVNMGREMVRTAPSITEGWINRSFALHEMRRTAEARAELLPAVEWFPKEPIIPYNLACYACQLGDMEAASRWFSEAVKRGGAKKMKAMGLDDPDLLPMKEEIRKL